MKLLNKIYVLLAAIFTSILLEGCVSENFREEESLDPDRAILVLHIRNLTTRTENPTDGVSEKIKSLRIVLINEENEIECNDKIKEEYLYPDSSSPDLYYFFKVTTPGKKKLYLFANEESVNSIEGYSETDLTLADFLDKYLIGGKASEFETGIKSVFFKSDYAIDNKKIFLPYSCYYELDMEAGKRYEQPMFLVPVATKFDLIINNERNDEVEISRISIISLSDRSYLMAHVGEKDYRKDNKYWIDWLAEISDKSHDYPQFSENEDFNESYGWITDYQTPDQALYTPINLVAGEKIDVDRQKTEAGKEPVPGNKIIPTVYNGESAYIPSGMNNEVQSYSIQVVLKDKTSSDPEVTLTRTLSNVKALFRNTHVVININLVPGYMHVYGEIQPWEILDTVNGYVTEEQ